MADDFNSPDPIASDLFALDMCVLAYQVYNQSLLWPLDPYYEEWSRIGSSRRDNTLAITHQLVEGRTSLRGPGSTRGWATNPQLDPIITDYADVAPWRGCAMFDGLTHRYLAAHPDTVAAINEVVVSEYGSFGDDGPAAPFFSTRRPNPKASTDARDRLYAFEGATGSYDGKPPAWSLMGIVLERHRSGADYEVHIAYRGSQSGSAERAAFEGFVLEQGNPDWVTDMEVLKNVQDGRIATGGKAVLGLRDAVLTSTDSIAHCLADIAERNGAAPASIHITGHSLGGALATQLAAALTIGTTAEGFPSALVDWPWRKLRLTAFSAPKCGNADFAEQLDAALTSRRVWASGDPIVAFPYNHHAGVAVELDAGVSGAQNHEPIHVRSAIVKHLRADPVHASDSRLDTEPWRYHDDLAAMLLAAEADGDSIADLFPAAKLEHLELFVEIAARVVAEPSSYRWRWNKPRSKLRKRGLLLKSSFATELSSIDRLASGPTFAGVQPDSTVEGYLRKVHIVREAARNGWTASELIANPEIAAALQA
ncbi:MAG: hypothetical protein AAF567_25610 [Actinomycetota bacterium]